MCDDNSESLSIGTTSKSYASTSVISDEGCSSADLPRQRPRMSPLAARCNEMKLKVIQFIDLKY